MFSIPSNRTAMIGGMPHGSSQEALDALSHSPLGIPTWPQLPRRSFLEGMIVQYCGGMPGIQIDEKEKKIWERRITL